MISINFILSFSNEGPFRLTIFARKSHYASGTKPPCFMTHSVMNKTSFPVCTDLDRSVHLYFHCRRTVPLRVLLTSDDSTA